jgi:DNA-binding GntR family transcriptional regulator
LGRVPQRRSSELPLGEVVYRQLTDMIIHGELAPGEPLREMRLAEAVGTSRVPIREALQRLADEGWVIRRPRSGARVKVPSQSDVDEIFDLRVLLEVEAVRRALRHISLSDADALREVIDLGRAALSHDDLRAVVVANSAFHSGIAQLTRNELLVQMLAMLDRRVRWLFGTVALTRSETSLAQHAALLDALVDRDVEAAVEITTQHVEQTRAALHEQWQANAP